MLETLLDALKPVAPLLILVASFADTFIGTGYFLYGFAMLATVNMMLLEGMLTIPQLLILAWVGTVAASLTNYVLGRFFTDTHFVTAQQQKPAIRTLTRYLDRYGIWWLIVIGRFVTFLRPSYAFLLGLLHRSWRQFIVYEGIVAAVWVGVWLGAMILGQRLLL